MTTAAVVSDQNRARVQAIPTIDTSILFLCDIQDKFGKHLPNIERVVASSKFLRHSCSELLIPVIATEQYPKIFGKTRPELILNVNDENNNNNADDDGSSGGNANMKIFEKTLFSMYTEDVSQELSQNNVYKNRNNVILTGIEGHICVLQTTLDLLNNGYNIFLCVDAIDSQRAEDKAVAIKRLESAGAILTTSESIVFQLLRDSKHPKFKAVQQFVKQHIVEVNALTIGSLNF